MSSLRLTILRTKITEEYSGRVMYTLVNPMANLHALSLITMILLDYEFRKTRT